MKNLSDYTQAVLWMLYLSLCSSIIAGLSRVLTKEIHPMQLVCMSMFVGSIFLLLKLRSMGFHHIKTNKLRLYIIRAILEFSAFSMVYYAVSTLPLPIFQALTYTNPPLATLVAIIVLKEKATKNTWFSLLIGFIGMLIIVRPGIEPYVKGPVLMITAMAIFAVAGTIIKFLTRTEQPIVIAFYMMPLTFLVSLPFAVYNWQEFSPSLLYLVFFHGFFAFTQQIAVTKALSKADIVAIIPVTFSSLIFTSIIAYLFFDEIIDVYTIVGAIIILYGTIHMSIRTNKLNKEQSCLKDQIRDNDKNENKNN